MSKCQIVGNLMPGLNYPNLCYIQCVQNSPIGTHGLYRVVADGTFCNYRLQKSPKTGVLSWTAFGSFRYHQWPMVADGKPVMAQQII